MAWAVPLPDSEKRRKRTGSADRLCCISLGLVALGLGDALLHRARSRQRGHGENPTARAGRIQDPHTRVSWLDYLTRPSDYLRPLS